MGISCESEMFLMIARPWDKVRIKCIQNGIIRATGTHTRAHSCVKRGSALRRTPGRTSKLTTCHGAFMQISDANLCMHFMHALAILRSTRAFSPLHLVFFIFFSSKGLVLVQLANNSILFDLILFFLSRLWQLEWAEGWELRAKNFLP